jgi:hypothetical protein
VDDSSAADSGSTSGSASELGVAEVDFAAGVATISNTSTDAIGLSGHLWCNRPEGVVNFIRPLIPRVSGDGLASNVSRS